MSEAQVTNPGGMRFDGARVRPSAPGERQAISLFFASGDASSSGSLIRINLEEKDALALLEELKALLIRSPAAVVEGLQP
jgi:hypothetical protein